MTIRHLGGDSYELRGGQHWHFVVEASEDGQSVEVVEKLSGRGGPTLEDAALQLSKEPPERLALWWRHARKAGPSGIRV